MRIYSVVFSSLGLRCLTSFIYNDSTLHLYESFRLIRPFDFCFQHSIQKHDKSHFNLMGGRMYRERVPPLVLVTLKALHMFIRWHSHIGNCEDGIQPSLKTWGMDGSTNDHKRALFVKRRHAGEVKLILVKTNAKQV